MASWSIRKTSRRWRWHSPTFPWKTPINSGKSSARSTRQRQLRDYYHQFCRGAAKNGASPETIDKIWAMIMSFAGYSFCKPHSASYAQVSFKSAYLRAHYPAEFMAAVISNQGGFYSAFAYLSEARRMGLAILPPDVNASDWAYRGEGDRLDIGLMQVRTIPQAARRKNHRGTHDKHGPYRSFQDFSRRVEPEPAQARALIRAGCCDSLAGELTRPALLWRLYADERSGVRSACPCPMNIRLNRNWLMKSSRSAFWSAAIL